MAPCLHITNHMDMDRAPCPHIITHIDLDMALCSMSASYHPHGYGYGSIYMDIITYMDMDMAPYPHITAQSRCGSKSAYYCWHGYGMTPCLHICHFKFIIPY